MNEIDLQIILPPRASEDDPLDHMLVEITKAIEEHNGEQEGYGLGGPSGYGAAWDSDVFMMHRYCWCERDDCVWCSEDACGCPFPECEFYLDGKRIHNWSEENSKIVAPMPHDVAKYGTAKYKEADRIFSASIAERNRRLKTIYPERIHTCEPRGMMENRPRGGSWQPRQSAPHFWHKSSGLKVWWYKWIGRDMEAVNLPADLTPIFRECLADIASVDTLPKGRDTKGLGAEQG